MSDNKDKYRSQDPV